MLILFRRFYLRPPIWYTSNEYKKKMYRNGEILNIFFSARCNLPTAENVSLARNKKPFTSTSETLITSEVKKLSLN